MPDEVSFTPMPPDSMHFGGRDHALIGRAGAIPTAAPTTVVSVCPIVIPTAGRPVDLEVRVSAPLTGGDLPLILLSHGQGFSNHLSSLNGYAPLAQFWAARGFAVIQPTHLGSRTLALPSQTPGAPIFWRSRVTDMSRILDWLDLIEASVPGLAGRLDKTRVAVAGHSMGGHTAGMLLGARLIDPDDGVEVDLVDRRIGAGVLLAAPVDGGSSLNAFATEAIPCFRHPNFATMTTPTLVVAGDRDASNYLCTRGLSWHADPYRLAPGLKALLTLFGGEHILGGVSGYDVAETTDENPERVATIQRMTWAYLRSALYPGDPAWTMACAALGGLGSIESK
ncbi:alpha/beta hydrolase family protein [Acetobacter nitrogenifigens]|nr:chlorophyllase [Acetobacter nitrogenifigens]